MFSILQRIIDGVDRLAWSAILDFENSQHPLRDRRTQIARWAQRAGVNIDFSDQVLKRAYPVTEAGLGALDVAHIAAAEAGACDRLLTCDDELIRKARRMGLALRVQNPVEFLEEHTHA